MSNNNPTGVNSDATSNTTNKTITKVLEIFNKGWNKQVILYGPPGTSKTFSATIIAAAFLGMEYDENKDNNYGLYEGAKAYLENLENSQRYKLVQFHPSYSYEDFVRGITVKPEGTGVKYVVESKIIEKFADKAKKDKEGKPYVLVIDEINRAPLASVLGELIYGLEYREQYISTPYSMKDENGEEKKLVIPDNLYIIGTMNTADRSIGSMDYAVRRRFAFLPVLSMPDVIGASWKNENVRGKAETLYKYMMDKGNGIFTQGLLEDQEMMVDDIKIGHTYFLGKNDEKDEEAYLKYRIEYQILPIYQEYIKDGLIKKEGLQIFHDRVVGALSDHTFADEILPEYAK